MSLKFAERLDRAHRGSRQPGLRGPRSGPRPPSRGLAQRSGAALRLQPPHRRCDPRPAAAYKPQIAFYSALGKEDELAASIRYIRERAPAALVILDAKRSDIGNTAEAYAREAFDRYDADAVTVNPYMGEDRCCRFLRGPTAAPSCYAAPRIRGAGIFRTCNRGSAAVPENRRARGDALEPARKSHAGGRRHATRRRWPSCGARIPSSLSSCLESARRAAISTRTLSAGLDAGGKGLLVSSSRAIIYAGGGTSAAIRAAARELHRAINRRASRRRPVCRISAHETSRDWRASEAVAAGGRGLRRADAR